MKIILIWSDYPNNSIKPRDSISQMKKLHLLAYKTSTSIPSSVFPVYFNDTSEFVNNRRTGCAGIQTVTLLESCGGDLNGANSVCLDAGLRVNSYMVSSYPNSTRCFFFAILYVVAIVNEFGPEDVGSASCILGIPLSRYAIGGIVSNNKTRKLVFGFVGGIIGMCCVITLFMGYRRWDKKKEENVMHEKYVTWVKSKVLPNMGAKWFREAELEQATGGFLQKNMIGRGGYGIVHKGVLSDGTEIAVKQILDLDYDDDFTNEAQIIRNLLPLRHATILERHLQNLRSFEANLDSKHQFATKFELNNKIIYNH